MPIVTGTESSDPRAVTPETVAALHAADLRTAVAKVWTRGLLLAGALGFWIVVGQARLRSLSFPLVGVTLFFAGTAALDWWRKQRIDPHTVAIDKTAFARLQAELGAEERHWARLDACRPWVTYGLIGCLAIIAFLQYASPGGVDGSVEAAGLGKDFVRHGEWWRLLTATYLHSFLYVVPWHLLANAGALLSLGRVFEAYASRTRLALVYLTAAIGGSLASLVLLPDTKSIGASGAIMGVAGFLFVLCRRRPTEVPPWLLRGTLFMFGLTAYIGFFGLAFIDNAAHAGGALAGILVGLATTRGQDARSRFGWVDALGAVAGVVIVAGAALTARELVRPRANLVTTPIVSLVVAPITSVVMRPTAGPSPVKTIEIENRRDVALDAWIVSAFSRRDARRPIANQLVDLCCAEAGTPNGPLPSHERRQVPAPPWMPQLPGSSVVSLVVVVFSDLSFEGSETMRDLILRQRADRADDLAYWMESLTEALAQPPSTVRSFLLARVTSRTGEAEAAHRPIDRSTITAIAEQAGTSPDQFADRARAAMTRMARERTALLARAKR